MAVKSYPNSAISNFYLATYLKKTGYANSSRIYYLLAIELFDGNQNINENLKRVLKNTIDKDLNSHNDKK